MSRSLATGDEARQHSDMLPQSASSHHPPKSGLLQRWTSTPADPDPWLQKYFAIGIAFAITIWSFYVVVGRVCAPALQSQSSQGYSKAIGGGTLVGFAILWLLFVWSYLKMLLTGPGFAKKLVPTCAPPPANHPSTSYVPYRPPPAASDDPDPSELAPVNNIIQHALQSTSPSVPVDGRPTKTGRLWTEVERPVPRVDTGVRWCRYCEINKPDRTHHCRHCGTCVMQFDHHCIWIGQCVGWANHKFFIIFNFWAGLFCLYTFIFLILSSSKSSDVDGQVIALIICSGFFGLFTILMVITHIDLILTGKTTLESFSARDQMEMENSVLHREFGYLLRDHEKRKVRKKWKEEFGGVEVDERWKVGSRKDRWMQEMGSNWLGWIVPIGRPLGNGLHFATNPAFGPNGEWLKKKDWMFS